MKSYFTLQNAQVMMTLRLLNCCFYSMKNCRAFSNEINSTIAVSHFSGFKLSVPPLWIYILSDAQLSAPLFGIFKSVCWYGNFVCTLVLSLRSVRQRRRRAMLCATDSRKRGSRAGTIFKSRDPFTYYDWTLTPLHLSN